MEGCNHPSTFFDEVRAELTCKDCGEVLESRIPSQEAVYNGYPEFNKHQIDNACDHTHEGILQRLVPEGITERSARNYAGRQFRVKRAYFLLKLIEGQEELPTIVFRRAWFIIKDLLSKTKNLARSYIVLAARYAALEYGRYMSVRYLYDKYLKNESRKTVNEFYLITGLPHISRLPVDYALACANRFGYTNWEKVLRLIESTRFILNGTSPTAHGAWAYWMCNQSVTQSAIENLLSIPRQSLTRMKSRFIAKTKKRITFNG